MSFVDRTNVGGVPPNWPLNALAKTSMLEEVMVMQRRMMLGGMQDPTAAVLTIIVTGLEEALVRCTMADRDDLWEWVTGSPKLTESETEIKLLIQAASSANGMRIEVTSILSSRCVIEVFLAPLTQAHAH